MSELKFTCPACGQHMQCEKAYVGHKIPCPSCKAELRIPFSDSPGGAPNALPRAELVLEASTEIKPPALEPAKAGLDSPFAASDIPKQIVVTRETETKTAAPAQPVELHCLCPVCQSELRIPSDAATAPGPGPRTAELVRKATVPAEEPQPAADKPGAHGATSEREHQIAAAREAHPVSLYPAMKPRLSYILSGGEAPDPQEPDKPPGPNVQTINE